MEFIKGKVGLRLQGWLLWGKVCAKVSEQVPGLFFASLLGKKEVFIHSLLHSHV